MSKTAGDVYDMGFAARGMWALLMMRMSDDITARMERAGYENWERHICETYSESSLADFESIVFECGVHILRRLDGTLVRLHPPDALG